MPDVVVIGGGVSGASIAYHLAKSGVRVTLVEKHTVGAGASGASAGGVRHQGRDLREFPLAFRAIERWRTLEAELGADLEYRRGGHLITIEHDEDQPALEEYVSSQQAEGLEITLLDQPGVRAVVPAIAPGVIAGGYSPNDGHANPLKTAKAFAAAAVRHGATVREGVAAARIATVSGRISGVETDDGLVAADVVVLAAGAWTTALAAPLGLHLPVTARGLQGLKTAPCSHVLDPVLDSIRRPISLKQLPDGRFLLGGGWPGEWDLRSPRGRTTAENIAGNVEAGAGIFPMVAGLEIEEAWLGIEAVAEDEVPILGPVSEVPGLFLAAGFTGHGFAISPAVGEAVAESIVTGLVPAQIADLTLERFGVGTAPAAPRPRVG